MFTKLCSHDVLTIKTKSYLLPKVNIGCHRVRSEVILARRNVRSGPGFLASPTRMRSFPCDRSSIKSGKTLTQSVPFCPKPKQHMKEQIFIRLHVYPRAETMTSYTASPFPSVCIFQYCGGVAGFCGELCCGDCCCCCNMAMIASNL